MSGLLGADVADNAMRIIIASAMLMAGFVVLCLSVWYYRRRYWAPEDSASPVWTPDDLRRLRESGELSEDEYQALRASMLGVYGAGSSRPGSPMAGKIPSQIDGRGRDFDLEKSPHG